MSLATVDALNVFLTAAETEVMCEIGEGMTPVVQEVFRADVPKMKGLLLFSRVDVPGAAPMDKYLQPFVRTLPSEDRGNATMACVDGAGQALIASGVWSTASEVRVVVMISDPAVSTRLAEEMEGSWSGKMLLSSPEMALGGVSVRAEFAALVDASSRVEVITPTFLDPQMGHILMRMAMAGDSVQVRQNPEAQVKYPGISYCDDPVPEGTIVIGWSSSGATEALVMAGTLTSGIIDGYDNIGAVLGPDLATRLSHLLPSLALCAEAA